MRWCALSLLLRFSHKLGKLIERGLCITILCSFEHRASVMIGCADSRPCLEKFCTVVACASYSRSVDGLEVHEPQQAGCSGVQHVRTMRLQQTRKGNGTRARRTGGHCDQGGGRHTRAQDLQNLWMRKTIRAMKLHELHSSGYD